MHNDAEGTIQLLPMCGRNGSLDHGYTLGKACLDIDPFEAVDDTVDDVTTFSIIANDQAHDKAAAGKA